MTRRGILAPAMLWDAQKAGCRALMVATLAGCAKGVPDQPRITFDASILGDGSTRIPGDASDAQMCGAAQLPARPIAIDTHTCSAAIVTCFGSASSDVTRDACVQTASAMCGNCLQEAANACAVNGAEAPCRASYACLAQCVRTACMGSSLPNCEALAEGVGGRCEREADTFRSCVAGSNCNGSISQCSSDFADGGVTRDAALDAPVREASVREASVRDGAQTPAEDGGTAPRAFVTWETRTGQWDTNVWSYAAAQGDRFCQQAADAQNLGGAWFAVVSDNSLTRRLSFAPVYVSLHGDTLFRFSGTTLTATANMPYDITDQSRDYLSDFFDPSSDYVWIWTGGLETGSSASHCNDWTSKNTFFSGTAGDIMSSRNFLRDSLRPCNLSARLLCFERR